MFGIQITSFMRCFILPFGTCPAVPYSSTLSHTGMIKKKVIGHKMYVVIVYTVFVWNISYSKNNSTNYKCQSLSMCSTHYFCRILIKVEFSWQIFENLSNTLKIHPVGAKLLCANRQTDMRKLIFAFWNFVNLHKNYLRMHIDAIFNIGCRG